MKVRTLEIFSHLRKSLTVRDHLSTFADHVLVLGEGGSMNSFEPSSSWFKNKTREFQNAEDDLGPSDSPVAKETAVDEKPSRTNDDKYDEKIKNQFRDSTGWWYYVKLIGPFHCLSLLFITLITVLAANFPRRYSIFQLGTLC
jgi:hypothetical protein